MRFETDVLTLEERSWSGHQFFRKAQKDIYDKACVAEIQKCGWEIPLKIGAQIVLVFSTEPVEGASRCRRYDLSFAGDVALRKSKSRQYAGPLWWWPEIVTP